MHWFDSSRTHDRKKMNTQCINTPCEWWWCQTHTGCLLHQHSLPRVPRVRDDQDLCVPKPRISARKKDGIRCSNIQCETDENITRHHLYPKAYRKGYAGRFQTIPLCDSCHKRVHRLKSNEHLAAYYNTKNAIINLLAWDLPMRTMKVLRIYNETELMAVA